MRKLTHIIWSFSLSSFLFFYLFDFEFFKTIIFSCLVGFFSFIPDLDIKFVKKIKRFNKKTFYIFSIITTPIKKIIGHRQITHSLFLPLIFFLFYFVFRKYFFSYVFLILCFSIFLHIFEDCLTKSGVKIFYPFRFKLRLAKFNTFSEVHYLILNLIGLGFFILFLILFF